MLKFLFSKKQSFYLLINLKFNSGPPLFLSHLFLYFIVKWYEKYAMSDVSPHSPLKYRRNNPNNRFVHSLWKSNKKRPLFEDRNQNPSCIVLLFIFIKDDLNCPTGVHNKLPNIENVMFPSHAHTGRVHSNLFRDQAPTDAPFLDILHHKRGKIYCGV